MGSNKMGSNKMNPKNLNGYDCSAGPSVLAPRATMHSVLAGNGLCNARASSGGALIQTSISSCVVTMTGMALA